MGAIASAFSAQIKTNDVSERCVRHNSTLNIIIDPV